MQHRVVYLVATTAALMAAGIWVASCQSSTDPYDVGGSGDLDLTEVGNEFSTFVEIGGSDVVSEHIKDTTVIIQREGGIVTFRGRYHIDSVGIALLDSLLGLQALPRSLKQAAIEYYVRKAGATLDTTNRNDWVVTVEAKAKITSDGIAEFFSSKGDLSRPRALVKYSWNVGDQITFTDDDGIKITRRVIRKSTTDDYPIGFWLIKTIDVEQTAENNPFPNIIDRAVIHGNHKFGLVGVTLYTATGKEVHLTIFPPTL
ncbi:MAG: hypothetical protein N2663_07010 [Chlorobi bacterium]|nr:hypothetical protein [Chlorobiota bacterium]